MSKQKVDLSQYDQAFLMAYELMTVHVEAGNAATADIGKSLAEVTTVIREFGMPQDALPQPAPHK